MQTEEIFAHFKTILDKMLNHPFYKLYFQAPYSLYTTEPFSNSITLHFGVTRGCIVDADFDYCVKFLTEQDDNSLNPCERELRFYDAAKRHKLEKYFAECNFIGNYETDLVYYDYYEITDHDAMDTMNDEELEYFLKRNYPKRQIHICVPLYAYPTATRLYLMRNLSKEEEDFCSRTRSPIIDRAKYVAAALWRAYGEEEFKRIDEFCRKYGIDDLHGQNVGDINGRIVFIDYAGFFG